MVARRALVTTRLARDAGLPDRVPVQTAPTLKPTAQGCRSTPCCKDRVLVTSQWTLCVQVGSMSRWARSEWQATLNLLNHSKKLQNSYIATT